MAIRDMLTDRMTVDAATKDGRSAGPVLSFSPVTYTCPPRSTPYRPVNGLLLRWPAKSSRTRSSPSTRASSRADGFDGVKREFGVVRP